MKADTVNIDVNFNGDEFVFDVSTTLCMVRSTDLYGALSECSVCVDDINNIIGIYRLKSTGIMSEAGLPVNIKD